MYKYDTHVHTYEASKCAISKGKQMAKAYKNAGFDGIIITDHFLNGNTSIDTDLPWEEQVEKFCLGYEKAKEYGDNNEISVFFGWEYAYEGSEWLTYGLDKEWLLNHPEIMDMNVFEYIRFVRRQGGFIVHAHPFRQERYITKFTLLPEITDAVEVFNARNAKPEYDDRAEWYATSYSLPKTSGSDSHNAENLDGAGIIVEHRLNSIEDYILAVKNREVELLKHSSFRQPLS